MGVGNSLGASGTSINRTDTLRGRSGPSDRLALGESTQRINLREYPPYSERSGANKTWHFKRDNERVLGYNKS